MINEIGIFGLMNIDLNKIAKLTGKDRKYFDSLMAFRDTVTKQLQYHVEDALSGENLDKRGVNTHMADIGSDMSRHDMDLRLLTAEGNNLQLIEDALERIVDGEYGICIECGNEIPEARLEVRPFALYCVKCKSILEKNGSLEAYV